jgi:hypothetical protein
MLVAAVVRGRGSCKEQFAPIRSFAMRPFSQRCLIVVLAVSGWAGLPYPVQAQGLGDVARKEEVRRKDIKDPAKVYTNKDLGSVPESSSGTLSAPGPAPAAPAETAKADKDAKANTTDKTAKDPKKDEAYWSGRKKALQSELDTAQTLAEALQSRINGLNTDFVNRDDPVQRAAIDRDRQKAGSELDRLKKSIADNKKALSDLEEDARKAGVPAGWLR